MQISPVEEKLVRDIRDKTRELNDLIIAAHNTHQLRVELSMEETHTIGNRYPRPRLLANVSMSLSQNLD